jgi:hypothetical protein
LGVSPEGLKRRRSYFLESKQMKRRTRKPTAGQTDAAMQVDSVVPPPLTAQVTDRIVTGVVASGHTIEQPTGQVVFRCFGHDGSALYRPLVKQFGPGAEVTLAESELRRLQELGFVEIPGMVIRSESEAAQRLGAKVVELNNSKDAADDQRARVDDGLLRSR